MIDACAIFWAVNWPTNRLVFDYISINYDFVFLKLQCHEISVVFDYDSSNMYFTIQGNEFVREELTFLFIIYGARKISSVSKRPLQK